MVSHLIPGHLTGWPIPAAGLASLKATTVAQVKRALPSLEEEIDMDPDAFQDFCTFAFKFLLTVCSMGP